MTTLREQVVAWYTANKSFKIEFAPEVGCELPDHLYEWPTVCLDIGRSLSMPVVDLVCGAAGFRCTLSFPSVGMFEVYVPWSCVYGLRCGSTCFVAPSKIHQVYNRVAPVVSVTRPKSGSYPAAGRVPNNPRARALGLRVLKGESDEKRTTTPKDPA